MATSTTTTSALSYMPLLDYPFTTQDGKITVPWAMALRTLQKSVSGTSGGGTPQVVALTSNPFIYPAGAAGMLGVDGGLGASASIALRVYLSRGSGWRLVGTVFTLAVVQAGDQVKISWEGSNPPTVVWYPNN